jgi:hypothetical protein
MDKEPDGGRIIPLLATDFVALLERAAETGNARSPYKRSASKVKTPLKSSAIFAPSWLAYASRDRRRYRPRRG